MKNIEIEVFSGTSNCGIVRMPGRRYPGCIVQGDSLFILFSTARSIAEEHPDSEAASELTQLLKDRLLHYRNVLQDHGMDTPYKDPKGEV